MRGLAHRQPPAEPRFEKPAPWKRPDVVAGALRARIVRQHGDVVAARGEALRQIVRDALDASALEAGARQAVAHHRDLQRAHRLVHRGHLELLRTDGAGGRHDSTCA